MPSLILPPSIHALVFIPSLDSKFKAQCYLIHLMDYSEFLRSVYVKFRFGKGPFKNPAYESKIQHELLEIESYMSEVESIIQSFDTKQKL